MKVFTKLGLALLTVFISASVLWAQSSIYELAPKKPTAPIASEALFDLQFEWPVGVGGGEAGIETDGTHIYTTKWNGGDFYRYGMDGTYIESFTVAGASAVRDLAFNGTYFYGGAASPTVFEMDFNAQTLIGTISAPTDCRAIAYNEDDDAFYANNWGSAITKFDMAGANLGSFPVGPVGDSYYGFAYQGATYCPGEGPFLWGYAQVGANQSELIQIELPSGTETGVTFDVGTVLASVAMAGGLCIDNNLFTGYWTIMGTCQNVNIWGLELCSSGPLPANDVGIQSIIEPNSGMALSNAEPVAVRIKNYGTDSQSNFDVWFTLDGGTPVTETISATINGGDTYDHTFGTTVDLSAIGSYDFEACTDLTGDENTTNDCTTKTVVNSEQAYCDASTTTEDEWIANVLCGDIDNSSGWQGGVADYTDQSTIIDAGSSEDIVVTNGNAWASDAVYAWVDWNMDFEFGIGGDEEFPMVNVGGAGETFEGTISVPAGTANGLYRMRVRMVYSAIPAPCGNSSYGEVEDYSIMVGEAIVGHLDGTVTAVGGGAIEGATVSLAGTSYSATTISDGTYLIENINVGDYTAECSAAGYQTGSAPVTITENVTTTQDFELEEASMLEPPTNFVAVVQDDDDVYCTWEPPPVVGGVWIQWDAGTNSGNGIGLTNGGTFYTTSHWMPAELAPYDGQNITTISFFANGDAAATYELMAWTGPNAGTQIMTQAVASFTVDDFNEVTLTTPITIDASDELWFGYGVTHAAGTFPGGCDDGPAIQYSGDMISLDGTSWVSMGADYGLDYNWNIAAYVVETDATYEPVPMVKSVNPNANGSFTANGAGTIVNKFNPSSSKALLGYNVYNDDNWSDYTTDLWYLHSNVAPGTYDYWATAVYDEGESGPSNTDEVTIEGTSTSVFEDDFEDYNVGDQLACVNPEWTTWSNAPCGSEDPYIVNNVSNVVEITGTNDLVYEMPNWTELGYEITFDIFIPTGGDGYFNTLQEFNPTPTWGMQVYFGHTNPGEANIDAGVALAAPFNFNYDTWYPIYILVDLDNDHAEFWFDNQFIVEWVWSTGTFGTGTLNQLGGSNFFAWDGGVYGNPLYHFDNYMIEEYIPPEWPTPENVDAIETDPGDVLVTWDPPAGAGQMVELVQHDGNFENAYYQAYDNGYGVVYDISAYPGATIEKLDFRHSSWGITGIWDYKIHVVDWDTYTEVAVIDGLQTTGDDQWEENISLGSIAGESGLVGIFLEPLSNDPADAYPCLDSDNVGPDGMSYFGPLADYSGMGLSDIGDFLMDLWIMTGEDKVVVKPPKVTVNTNTTSIARVPGTPLTVTEYTMKQMENTNSAKSVLEGFNIWRDGADIAYVDDPAGTSYLDEGLSAGTYTFCVSAVYDDGESQQVCAPDVVIEPTILLPPTDLTGPDVVTAGNDIVLNWNPPGSGNTWMQWDAGINTGNGIGLTDGGTFSCASHWEPADLTNYNGLSLTKVQFYANGDAAATYVIKVWTGSAGTNEVHSQAVGSFNVDDWNDVILDNPITINGSDDFWFGYEVTHGAGTFPAGCDDGPAIQYKGDMISLSGGAWASMSAEYGLDYNWNIAGWVEYADGKSTPMGIPASFASNSGSFAASGSTGVVNKMDLNSAKALTGYNIYRDGVEIGDVAAPTTTYTDVVTITGQYEYCVTAVYDNGESECSNTHEVDVITGIEENILSATQIFPNPANDIVNIESDYLIESVTIFNYAGQVVSREGVNN
ncbi:MAG: carboxypeptidase regulatory-like domain-containing protein, partial [Bacteroidales bacterium]|nr:carboxypeptidase regulatory-like domain-containing protein [Bacteroidales bacterium]